MFLGKGGMKICSKFTGEHPCRSVISIKLLSCKFTEEQQCQKCDFNKVALQGKAALLKSHFGMGVLQICWIFSEHLFLRIPLKGGVCPSTLTIVCFVGEIFLNESDCEAIVIAAWSLGQSL